MSLDELLAYPRWLEKWWVDEFLGHHADSAQFAPRGFAPPPVDHGSPESRLVEGKKLARLRELVDSLSGGFTTERVEGFGQYARDRKLLVAYGLFYFPQTFIRTRLVMEELLRRWKPADPDISMLDAGAGTGAAGLAAAERLASFAPAGKNIQLHALDESIQSMKILQELVSGTRDQWPVLSLQTTVSDLSSAESLSRLRGKKHDLMLASFVINEIFHQAGAPEVFRWVEKMMNGLKDNGVFVIMEPALKESAEKLEALRDLFARAGYRILAPCLHHGDCPLLKEGKFHCHEVREWSPPESFELINRKLFRSSGSTLKFSFLVVSRQEIPASAFPQEHSFRMISPWVRAKGKWLAGGCNHEGEKAEYEIQSRHLPRGVEKQFARMERGDVIVLKAGSVERKGGIYRIENLEAIQILKPGE